MRVIVVGVGALATAVLESLQGQHECTVIELDPARLRTVSDSFDVRVVRGDGATSEALQQAGVGSADLVLASTRRDETNLVTAMLARRLSDARVVIRTTDVTYFDAWRGADLDVDFVVASEFETASAVWWLVGGAGRARSTSSSMARSRVLQFDLSRQSPPGFCGRELAEASLPSRVVGIVRDGNQSVPGRGSGCWRATG